ncbi:MAG TPA: hypothetical protein VGI56_15370 [Galbitalea sp.]|jgi:hypothetical protein
MLSKAELVLGLTRHVGRYMQGPERAALGQLEFAGNVLEVSMRLRGSGVSTGSRVRAIAADAGISARHLTRDVLPTLHSLGWVEIQAPDATLIAVSEHIPPLLELIERTDAILAIAMLEPVELAVLAILDATTRMPLTEATAVNVGATVASEQDAYRAIDYLEALNLLERTISADEGVAVLCNPNVWSSDSDFVTAALRAEDGKAYEHLGALIEEIATTPGLPQDSVESTNSEWIDFAVSQGLIQRSLVVTSEGRERAFLFTPHMGRSAFGDSVGVDPSGHVRQLIGSMMYAKNFARFKLWGPRRFLQRMIEDGEAGDASSIKTDYPMLETAGIVRVEPAAKYHKLVLLQSDVAEQAMLHLQSGGDASTDSASGLRDQRRYVQPEQERARIRLARQPETSPAEMDRLMAAVRQTAGSRRFGN